MEEEILDRENQLKKLEELKIRELKRKNIMNKLLKKIEGELFDAETEKKNLTLDLDNEELKVKELREVLDIKNNLFFDESKRKEDLNKILQKKKNTIHEYKNNVLLIQRNIKKFENKISGTKKIIKELNEKITNILGQQKKYEKDLDTAHFKFFEASGNLEVKNCVISNLQEKNKNLFKKLKQQKSFYVDVRKHRNVYSKNLLDVKEEIQSLNKSYKALSHQIKQIKEEIKLKTTEIIKSKKDLAFIKSENADNKAKKNVLKKKIKNIESNIDFYQEEVAKLKKLIFEAREEKKNKMNIQESIISERDLLSIQLFKRQEELIKIIQNLKSIESDIKTDKNFFDQKTKEIEERQIKLNYLKKENSTLKEELKNYHPLKMEILKMQKETLKLQTKNSALKNQLSIPINIHRWRKIEATEPEKYEKIIKIQEIQKRIVEKNEQIKKQEIEIQNKEKELFEYKNIISRHAYNNTEEDIKKFKNTIKEKTGNMKQMIFELKNAQDNIKKLNVEIELIQSQINRYEKNYFEKRQKEELKLYKNNKENIEINNY